MNVAARLEGLAEPGGICISESVRAAVGTSLALSYESIGEQPVKNIAESIHAHRVRLEPVGKSRQAATRERPHRRWALLSVVGVMLIVTSGVGLWQLYSGKSVHSPTVVSTQTTASLALPEQPSLVVLPITNLSDDRKQDFFIDGLTEDLIADLAKVSGLFVISRNSAFTYRNQAVNVKQVASELGVRYVIEGSVRRAEDRIRINAQLIDALNDHHLWADRYDRVLDDVFAVQDDVKQKIVAALSVKLKEGEQMQLARKPTDNVKAYEYFLRGWRDLAGPGNIRRNQGALTRSIELDPDFAEARAALAMSYAMDYRGTYTYDDWVRPPTTVRTQARSLAQKASALDPTLALPELVFALMRLSEREYHDAVEHVQKAAALEPSNSRVHATRALILTAMGRHQEALAAMRQAMRLDPKPPNDYHNALGKVFFALRNYEGAIEALEKWERSLVSSSWLDAYYLPASYALSGQSAKAKAALEYYLEDYYELRGFSMATARLDLF